MSSPDPHSRTGATKPEATKHLNEKEKQALDASAEAEHAEGPRRENLIKEADDLGGKSKQGS